MTDVERTAKNKQISQTKHDTVERHKNMIVRTFDVKIQVNRLSKAQKDALETIFLEQKWYKNYILNWCAQDSNNKLSKFDTKINDITKKDKDMNDIPVHIKYLSAQSRQCLVSRMCSNIKTLHTLKINGIQKPGKLKFSKEETIIDLKQYGTSHKILTSKRIKIAGIPKTVIVSGLDQFIEIPEIELANARLLHRATGYFVQFIVYLPKNYKKLKPKINKTIGIDFGCVTSFALSTGEKIDSKIQESDRIKRLQAVSSRKLVTAFRQKYGHSPDFKNTEDAMRFKTLPRSKSFRRVQAQIRKEYQKITNRKNDAANKLVSRVAQYETVVIQDEQLQNWQRNKHGKAVQHSALGRVKAKLKRLDNVVILGRTVPTTKLCTKCGEWHDEMRVWNRVFRCDCGVEEDRDVHAAKNMVWFYENKVGVERTKVTRVEMRALVDQVLRLESQLPSAKLEDSVPLGQN